jgi:hypothetical protein
LLFGFKPSRIAARLGIRKYVVRVIARDKHRPVCAPPTEPKSRRIPNACRSIDASPIRMVHRMLAVGILPPGEIAREARVSESTVGAIARGERHAGEGFPPRLMEGERYVREGTRCSTCGANIIVIPCRACSLRKNSASMLQNDCSDGRHGSHAVVKKTFGVKAMPDLLPVLSAEISAFLSSPDKREYLITRGEKLFDQIVEPIDLPGPDRLIDPVLRAVIRPLVGRVYDEVIKKLEVPAHAA